MTKHIYRGFDNLDADCLAFHALPLCDILHSFIGERDYSYIEAVFFPIELVEYILCLAQFEKNVDVAVVEQFKSKYLTVDSLYPIARLIELWGLEKFNQMISELRALCE